MALNMHSVTQLTPASVSGSQKIQTKGPMRQGIFLGTVLVTDNFLNLNDNLNANFKLLSVIKWKNKE